MTTAEPFLPRPGDHDDKGVPAADPGAGAPEPAPGFGVAGEEPDRVDAEPTSNADVGSVDTPFRTPVPPGDQGS